MISMRRYMLTLTHPDLSDWRYDAGLYKTRADAERYAWAIRLGLMLQKGILTQYQVSEVRVSWWRMASEEVQRLIRVIRSMAA